MTTDKHNKRPNVPPLRFPEFTEPWETAKLGDMTVNFSKRNKDEIEYPMYSVTNNRGFIPQSEQFEDREMVSSDIKSYKIITKGDFAYNPARINVGSIAKYNGDNDCMISSLYVAFRAKEQINAEWLMQLLKTPKMNFYYNLNAEGGVRMYLFYPNFERIRTSYPSLNEQRKVAQFLDLLDHRIAVQSGLINKLESLISGIIERLTAQSPNVRISDCLECHSSTLQENQLNDTGGYRVYGANGICGYTDSPGFNGDAILIVKDGSGVGNVSYAIGEYSVIGTSNYLTAKNGYSLRYLYYSLMKFNFAPYKTGMAIPHIYFKDYGKAKIYCPSLEEQERIASNLSKIERKIEIERSIKDNCIMQKQYLLQQMFI